MLLLQASILIGLYIKIYLKNKSKLSTYKTVCKKYSKMSSYLGHLVIDKRAIVQ